MKKYDELEVSKMIKNLDSDTWEDIVHLFKRNLVMQFGNEETFSDKVISNVLEKIFEDEIVITLNGIEEVYKRW